MEGNLKWCWFYLDWSGVLKFKLGMEDWIGGEGDGEGGGWIWAGGLFFFHFFLVVVDG